MNEYRCTKCDKLLFEGDFTGEIRKKCPKCKMMNIFTQSHNNLEKVCNLNK